MSEPLSTQRTKEKNEINQTTCLRSTVDHISHSDASADARRRDDKSTQHAWMSEIRGVLATTSGLFYSTSQGWDSHPWISHDARCPHALSLPR